MGIINAHNTMSFISGDAIVNKVRRRLRSYDGVDGIIRDEDIYDAIRLTIDRLGCGVYEESHAMVEIANYKGDLPPNFTTLYAAYVCQSAHPRPVHYNLQGRPAMYYTSICSDLVGIPIGPSRCDIRCPQVFQPMCRITVAHYVGDSGPDYQDYDLLRPMQVVTNTRSVCDKDCICLNYGHHGDNELQINPAQKLVGVNFKEGAVYMQYWGFPLDEMLLPKVPDNSIIEKAISDYSVYDVLRDAWMNADVPDLQNKMAVAKEEANASWGEANNYVKLPTFAGLVDIHRKLQRNRFARYERIIRR